VSYVVTIKRQNGAAVTPQQLQAAIADDPSLRAKSLDADNLEHDYLELSWHPEGQSKPALFILQAGEVCVTTPSDSALRKMQELAGRLGARVIGEEGEDLTDVPIPESELSWAGLTGCAVIVVVLAAVVWWLVAG
jgi:hypothetical protein